MAVTATLTPLPRIYGICRLPVQRTPHIHLPRTIYNFFLFFFLVFRRHFFMRLFVFGQSANTVNTGQSGNEARQETNHAPSEANTKHLLSMPT